MRVILPNVKAHIAVAMVAFLVTGLAIEDMIHEGIIHDSPAIELLIKRQLRSSSYMTSEDASNREERRLAFNMEGVSTTAEKVLEELVTNTKVWWWWWTKGDSDTLFTYLNLEVNDDLFSKPEFVTWFKLVFDKYEYAVFDMMTETILRQSDEITAAKVIFDTDEEPIDRLQTRLLNHWDEHGETPEILLRRLYLGKDARSLLDNSLFKAWTRFVRRYGWDDAKMIASLQPKFELDDIVMAIAEGHNVNVINRAQFHTKTSVLGVYYARQLKIWDTADLSETKVGELLRVDSADITFPTTFLASTWLDYVLLRAMASPYPDKDYKKAVLEQLPADSHVMRLLGKENIQGPLRIWKDMLLSEELGVKAWQVKFAEVKLVDFPF